MASGRRRRPRQERSKMVVDAIVEAAIELLRKRDDNPSIRDIAKRAGVGVGSVYDYFEGRHGVVDAVFERITRDNFDEMIARWEAHAELELVAAIHATLDDTIELYLGRGALTRAAIRSVMRLGRLGYVTKERDRFCRAIARRFEDELPDVPPATIERALVGAVDMIMGVLVSELHRDDDPARGHAAREQLRRMLEAEVQRLRALPR